LIDCTRLITQAISTARRIVDNSRANAMSAKEKLFLALGILSIRTCCMKRKIMSNLVGFLVAIIAAINFYLSLATYQCT